MSNRRKQRQKNKGNVKTIGTNEKYVPVYTKSDHENDEKSFSKAVNNNTVDWNAFRRLMIHDLCTNTNILNTGYLGCVKIEDAIIALKCPERHWRVLIEVSKELMHSSPHYFRLNSLYSNMALFCWGIDLYNVSEKADIGAIKRIYENLAAKLENMHLKHEFAKIMRVLTFQDIYCGLVIESNSDFFFQEINYKNCRLYQVQDGLYNFDIDLSKINPKKINAYPDYVQEAYLNYIDNKISNWYLPPADKQICIKMNCQWTYPFPLLIGLVQDILDLDVYKKLKLQSARTDNYKAIMIKVPIDETTVDKPLLTPDTLGVFAEINRESMSDDIGIIHVLGSDGEAISFKDSNNTRNNVSDAVNELYNSSGESQELFNGSSSGTALTLSVENDAGFVYGVYRQFERWVNRYVKLRKYNKVNFKFYFYLLDITIFNRDKVSGQYKDASTLGLPVIDKYLSSLGMTPSRTLGSYITHKSIFDFANNCIPLQSTYNSSGEAGRPTNASQNKVLDVEGEKTADGEKNDR